MVYLGFDDEEVWKPLVIDGEKTKYSVSSYGNVKNNKTGKLLNMYKQNDGYYGFTVSHRGKPHSYKIAHVVATLFIDNDDPDNKTQVDHLRGKDRNTMYDLEWVTPQENIIRDVERRSDSGETKKNKKYSRKEIKMVCKLLEKDYTITSISEKTGMSPSVIRAILYGKRHTEISKDYNFSKRSKSKRKSGKKPKYSEATIRKICKMYIKGKKISEIAKKLDMPENTVHGIIFGKYVAYRHITAEYDLNREKPKPDRYTSDKTVKKICKLLEKGKSEKEIMSELGVSKKVVCSIRERKSFTDISKDYDF